MLSHSSVTHVPAHFHVLDGITAPGEREDAAGALLQQVNLHRAPKAGFQTVPAAPEDLFVTPLFDMRHASAA
jgi:hypothetical protein